jgi:MoxR-like ATPase
MPDTATATSSATPFPDRLRSLRDHLLTGLVERDVAIRLALLAALSGEHLLLVGPPGTAKSLVARRLGLAFRDTRVFERLLTKYTVPEELFGPLSIRGLEQDRYERLTEGFLPTAHVAFLDEVFKANSAILNALLTMLNERRFDNGTDRVDTPLVAVVAASNELPEGGELEALYDRFLLRLHVGPVSDAGFGALLGLDGEAELSVPEELALSSDELDAVRLAAAEVPLSDDVVALLMALRKHCRERGLPVSDRRWRKVKKLLQVSAITNAREEVTVWDCWLLQHCLWDDPADREGLFEWYAERVGAKQKISPRRLAKVVDALELQADRDRTSESQARDAEGRKLFVGENHEPTSRQERTVHYSRDGEPLFLAPVNGFDRHGHTLGERTQNGKGYSRAELDRLYAYDKTFYNNRTRFSEWSHRDAYLQDSANRFRKEYEHPPLMEPTRQKRTYVDTRIADVDSRLREIANYQADLDAHIDSLVDTIRTHLWLLPEFAERALRTLQGTKDEVRALHARLSRVRGVFERLPIEAEVDLGTDDDETGSVFASHTERRAEAGATA